MATLLSLSLGSWLLLILRFIAAATPHVPHADGSQLTVPRSALLHQLEDPCKAVWWLQGDDYILYCHPNRQKTPRSDRLREWYHMLLRQAKSEGIVTYLSNLYDTFFEGGKDHRVDKPSVLHLPYFEGALLLHNRLHCSPGWG